MNATDFHHMPYGYRRWNGTQWCNNWVDNYNAIVDRITALQNAGHSAERDIEDMYRTAARYDAMELERKHEDEYRDMFVPYSAVKIHPASDLYMRGERRATVIKNGTKYVHVRGYRSGRIYKLLPRDIMADN